MLFYSHDAAEQHKVAPANHLGTFAHGLSTLPSGGPPASPFGLGDSAAAGTFAHPKHRLADPSRLSDWATPLGRGPSPIQNTDLTTPSYPQRWGPSPICQGTFAHTTSARINTLQTYPVTGAKPRVSRCSMRPPAERPPQKSAIFWPSNPD